MWLEVGVRDVGRCALMGPNLGVAMSLSKGGERWGSCRQERFHDRRDNSDIRNRAGGREGRTQEKSTGHLHQEISDGLVFLDRVDKLIDV